MVTGYIQLYASYLMYVPLPSPPCTGVMPSPPLTT